MTEAELKRVIGHMNDDHRDALVLYAQAFAKRGDVVEATMLDLTRAQIVLEVNGGERLAVDLTSPVETAEDAHHTLVAMVGQARKRIDDAISS